MLIPHPPITESMSKKQKIIYYILLSILMIIIFVGTFYEILNNVQLAYGMSGYNYVGTYYLTSQINQTTDDVVATIGNDYQDDSSGIPLKTSIFDLAIGLRFNDLSIPINDTHTSVIQWAYLSFYTTQTTYIENEQCMISFYYCNDNSTFSNYTDLVNRQTSVAYVNWNAYYLIGGGIWLNTSDIKDVILPPMPINNNGSIVLKILSAKGLGSRMFASYDHLAGQYAPKLYVCYKLYSTISGYQETYRGYDIYENQTVLPYMASIQANGFIKYCVYLDKTEDSPAYLIIDLSSCQDNWWLDYFIEISNGTKYYAMNGYLHKSIDEGKTWINLGKYYDDSTEWESWWCSMSYYNGTMHFLYTARKTGYSYDVCIYRNMTMETLVYDNSIVLKSSSLGDQWGGNIAVDKLGNVYCVWHGAQTSSSATRSYFREYNATTKTWSSVMEQPLTSGKHTYSMIECEQNHTGLNAWLFVAYHVDNLAGGIGIVYRTRNENKTWSSPATLRDNAHYVDTTMDIHNQVHITYYLNQAIYYKKYNIASGLGSEINVDGATHYYPSIECYNKSIYVFYHSIGSEKAYFKHKLYNDTTFSPKYQVYTTENAWKHQVGLKYFGETSLREGQENRTSYYYVDPDTNITYNDFDTIDDVKDAIDDLFSQHQVDTLPNLGSNIIFWMGLCGLGMIPLGFILFVLNAREGDWGNAFYMLMIMEIIGLGFIITWLWA